MGGIHQKRRSARNRNVVLNCQRERKLTLKFALSRSIRGSGMTSCLHQWRSSVAPPVCPLRPEREHIIPHSAPVGRDSEDEKGISDAVPPLWGTPARLARGAAERLNPNPQRLHWRSIASCSRAVSHKSLRFQLASSVFSARAGRRLVRTTGGASVWAFIYLFSAQFVFGPYKIECSKRFGPALRFPPI